MYRRFMPTKLVEIRAHGKQKNRCSMAFTLGDSKKSAYLDKLEVGEPIQAHVVRGILSP